MPLNGYNFLFLCLIALSLFVLLSHLYFTGIQEVARAEWRQLYGHESDLLQIPGAINYIPSDQELKTVIRSYHKNHNPPIPVDRNNSKLILFHTLKFGGDFIEKSWNWQTDGTFHYSDSIFKCPKKCKTTLDKRLAKDAHAVVFNIMDIIYNYNVMPGDPTYPNLKMRNQNQIWVATTLEASKYHLDAPLGQLDKLFNWTFTYRLDSDVYLPYGYFCKLETPRSLSEIQLPDTQALRTKKLAASLISNCGGRSGRETVITEMKKYVSVDSFGNCGKKCPVPECRQWLAEKYKFFLAFENSLCQDYITEKFFRSFEIGMVPVTYGLGDYAEVAPPHSYINALDFPTVKALTDYLVHLDQNDEEYLKYFHWKQNYALGPHGLAVGGHRGFAAELCSLCLKLWERMNFTQQITNFNDWWNHKRTPRTQPNSTIAGRLLQDTKTACVNARNIFDQWHLV